MSVHMAFLEQKQIRKQQLLQSANLEYTALRSEILKRIELRHQIIQTIIAFAGVILGFGLTHPRVALIFPPLAALFALSWVQSDYRIRDLADYIRQYIEPAFRTPGWETVIYERRKTRPKRTWRYIVFSHGGLFLGTQLMSIFIGIENYSRTLTENILLGISVLSTIYVGYIISKAPFQSDTNSLLESKP